MQFDKMFYYFPLAHPPTLHALKNGTINSFIDIRIIICSTVMANPKCQPLNQTALLLIVETNINLTDIFSFCQLKNSKYR